MKIKHILSTIFLVAISLITSSNVADAATMPIFSYTVSNTEINATATYIINYTIVTDSPTNLVYAYLPVGFAWSTSAIDYTVTIDDGAVAFTPTILLNDRALLIGLDTIGLAATDTDIIITANNVTNASTIGAHSWKWIYTATLGGNEIDAPASINDIVLTDPNSPTITNISSDKANGTYTVDEVIDIDVTFSEAVTSTGNVTVTLETGDTDRTCTFTLSSATTGTCNYTVQSGDETSDLTVSSISGTIEDGSSNAVTNFSPGINLAYNKDIIINTDVTAPTITNISSDKANGTYTVDEVIDIDVTFSEAVTSTGNVTVTLETGDTDRTCTFTLSSATTGTCNYTVQSGDETSDLTVSSISGTIEDAASNALVNFVPATNLADNKDIVIETTNPILSAGLPSTEQDAGTTEATLSLTTDENATCKYSTVASTEYASMVNTFDTTGSTSHSTAITELTDGNNYTYYVRCIDGIGNANNNDYEISFSTGTSSTTRSSTRRYSKSKTQALFSKARGEEVITKTITSSPSPSTTPTTFSGEQCSEELIINQNLKSSTRNGVYNSYTGETVTEVKLLQAHMNRLGFNSGPEDGIIGPLTDGAIKRMQAFLGTMTDGYVGPLTRGLINSSC